MASGWRYVSKAFDMARLARLNDCPAYEEIAKRIAKAAVVEKAPCAEGKGSRNGCAPGSVTRSLVLRPVFRLNIPPELMDVFHNGHDGYRARYHRSPADGGAANALLITLLTPKLERAWLGWPRRPCSIDWLRMSIDPTRAKVWIHQRRWARFPRNRRIKIELAVDRWLAHQSDRSAKIQKKVKLGALCPEEDELEIKGAFLNRAGVPVPEPKPMPKRAEEIYKYGYT